jgi:hypothetical protein
MFRLPCSLGLHLCFPSSVRLTAGMRCRTLADCNRPLQDDDQSHRPSGRGCQPPVSFRPRGFSPPRRLPPVAGSGHYCSPEPDMGFATFETRRHVGPASWTSVNRGPPPQRGVPFEVSSPTADPHHCDPLPSCRSSLVRCACTHHLRFAPRCSRSHTASTVHLRCPTVTNPPGFCSWLTRRPPTTCAADRLHPRRHAGCPTQRLERNPASRSEDLRMTEITPIAAERSPRPPRTWRTDRSRLPSVLGPNGPADSRALLRRRVRVFLRPLPDSGTLVPSLGFSSPSRFTSHRPLA